MRWMTFEAVVERDEASSGVFVVVPGDVREAFGRVRPPVVVTIGAHQWRTTVSVYGGRSLIGISWANRDAAGISAGDRVTVEVALDEAARTVIVPPDLAAALTAAPAAKSRFDAMSFTHRQEYVAWLDAAKRPETRARRLAAAVERIAAGATAG
jgi:hypothetical protein